MNFPVTRTGIALSAFLLAAGLTLAAASPAFQQQQQQQQTKPPDASSTTAPTAPPASGPLAAAEAPKVDPAEEADYKAFYSTDQADADTTIKLGEGFIQIGRASCWVTV